MKKIKTFTFEKADELFTQLGYTFDKSQFDVIQTKGWGRLAIKKDQYKIIVEIQNRGMTIGYSGRNLKRVKTIEKNLEEELQHQKSREESERRNELRKGNLRTVAKMFGVEDQLSSWATSSFEVKLASIKDSPLGCEHINIAYTLSKNTFDFRGFNGTEGDDVFSFIKKTIQKLEDIEYLIKL